jgi:hypothetical protein
MELNIIVDDYSMDLNVSQQYLSETRESFDRLDNQMNNGIQLGRNWIENPDLLQRCQSAADKLLTALETHNEGLAMMSAGYILSRMPGTSRVRLDTSGSPEETLFE